MSRIETVDDMDLHPRILVADDDATYCSVLAPALKKRGFEVYTAHDAESAYGIAERALPEYAVVDLKMPGDSGLILIERLKALDAEMRIVLLTGYASIATAVEAIKLGAVYYLVKPVDADEIVKSFARTSGDAGVPVEEEKFSVDRLEWEYIQRTVQECGGNISAAARCLHMHRRTLQRKLQKRPARR